MSGDLLWHSIMVIVPGLFTFLTFLLLYRFVPNTQIRFKDIWLGALVGTIAFEVAKNVFAWYVSSFASYSAVYGTLGKLVAFMVWIYISAAILLYGAEMAAEYPRVMAQKKAEPAPWRTPAAAGKGERLSISAPSPFLLELEALKIRGYNTFKRICQKTPLRRQ